MFNAGDISSLKAGTAVERFSYKDCLWRMICFNSMETRDLTLAETPLNESCKSYFGFSAICHHLNIIFRTEQSSDRRAI